MQKKARDGEAKREEERKVIGQTNGSRCRSAEVECPVFRSERLSGMVKAER